MRHLRSILYAVVLAPAVWVLTGVGLTGDLTTRGRDSFAVEEFTGLLLLMLAGVAYGILVLGPISPAGPLAAGVAFLVVALWAMLAPAAYAAAWSPGAVREGFDLSRPGYGLAALLAVPLICTALSARRWERYVPPVLPVIGPIGRFRGEATAPGTPIAIIQTAPLFLPTANSEDTTVPTQDPGDATLIVPPATDEPATVALAEEEHPAEAADGDPTEPLASALPDADQGTDDDLTEPVGAAPAASDSDAIPADEPTEAVGSVASDAGQAVDADEPTEPVGSAASDAEQGADAEPVAASDEAEDGAALGGEAVEPIADAIDGAAADPPDGDDGERTQVVRLPGAEPGDVTQVVRMPAGDDGERTQVVRLPGADVGEKTQVVRLPLGDSGEKTQVLKMPGVPSDDRPVGPGERTRDLAHRSTGDVGGDETQVIRLPGRPVSEENTQVIRPGLVPPPGERTQELRAHAETIELHAADAAAPARANGPVSIAGAEQPDISDDPTSRIVPPGDRGDEEETAERAMTVMKMERPQDELAGDVTVHIEIPTQRRPADDD